MNLRPLKDWVVVKRLETEDKIGSIVVPDKAKTKALRGEVIAVGPGRRDQKTGHRIPPEVHKGDVVCYGLYSGSDMMIEGVEHLTMREDEILGVIEKDPGG
jgi:chaperonin GroES